MFKKVISLFCVSALAFSLIACGNDAKQSKESSVSSVASKESKTEESKVEEKKEPVTITYWYQNGVGVQEYTQKVEDKLNEILANTEGYEHITIELHPCKDYQSDFTLAEASGAQIDVFSTPGLSGLRPNGSYMDITEIVEANPEITADLPEWFPGYGVANGVTEYIPNYQQMANMYYVYMNKEYFEQTGYSYDEVQEMFYRKDFDEIASFYEDVLLKVREYTGRDTIYIPSEQIQGVRMWVQPSNSVAGWSWDSYLNWDEKNQKVVFTDQIEEVKQGYIKNGEWFEKEYLYKDEATDKTMIDGMITEYAKVIYTIQAYGTAEMVAEQRNTTDSFVEKNGEIVVWNAYDYTFIPHSNAAGGTAIHSTCKNPEEAGKVLALLFNSKYEEFYNTLVYGLEGVHYNKLTEDSVKTLEFDGTQGGADTTYCFHKWRGGNTFNAWRNQSMTQEQKDYILNEINESDSSVVSPLVGIVLSTTEVNDEIAQIKAIMAEYVPTLVHGLKGSEAEAYYNEYMDKLEKAGLSKVLDHYNKQVENYLATK